MDKILNKFKSRANVLIFLVIIFLLRITILIRMRDSSSFTSLDVYNLIQIGSIAVLIVFLSKFKKLFMGLKNQSINYFILIYIIGMFSGLWSENFFYSTYRALEAYILFMACLSILNYYSFDFITIEKVFLRLLFIIGLLSLIGLLARRSTLSLELLHNNSYPITGAILASYCFGCLLDVKHYQNRKKILKRYLAFGLFLVILGTSLGSFLSFGIAVSLIVMFSSKKNKNFLLILISIFILTAVAFVNAGFILELILINKDVEELEGLNGRTRLWEMYLEMIYEKPFFGWGFDIIARSADFYTTNTHFFLISILGGMGLLGITVFFVGFFKLIKELFTYLKYKLPSYLGFIGALAAAFVNGGSKGYIGEHIYPESLSFFLLICFFSLSYQKIYVNAK
jgi:exopolysaccharide production protein ExoQ